MTQFIYGAALSTFILLYIGKVYPFPNSIVNIAPILVGSYILAVGKDDSAIEWQTISMDKEIRETLHISVMISGFQETISSSSIVELANTRLYVYDNSSEISEKLDSLFLYLQLVEDTILK